MHLANLKVMAYSQLMKTIQITPTDNRYTAREALRRAGDEPVLLTLSWDIEKGWTHPLDYEFLYREAQQREMHVAWVIEDPARQPVARAAGFHVFPTQAAAAAHVERDGTLPKIKPATALKRPKRAWWAAEPRRPKLPLPRKQPKWLIGLEVLVLVVVLLVVGGTAVLSLPSAHITLVPQGMTYSRVVKVSVDPTLNAVDLQRGIIPARRIGDEFEGYAEVGTTGRGLSFSGQARGQVLLTNLLGQDYLVPSGTVVRTTAGSYPVRFATTQDVTLPAFGQASAPIEALEEGPGGNVAAFQINLVEGVIGSAVRVTNPAPTTGAQSETVATASEEDRARVWDLAAQIALAEAYQRLQDPVYLNPGEFLPQQNLVVQAVPRQAYTHMVGARTNILGLSLRLLVTGQAVSRADAQAVAFRALAQQLPEGYTLIDARFEYGEAAEEDVGPGRFTFYVTAHGHAAAEINTAAAVEAIQGESIEDATATLAATLPLAQLPQITVTPDWFPFVPWLPIRTSVEVVPADWGN